MISSILQALVRVSEITENQSEVNPLCCYIFTNKPSTLRKRSMWQKIHHPSQKGIINFSQGLSGTTHPQLTSLPEEHITETQFTKLPCSLYEGDTTIVSSAKPEPITYSQESTAGTNKFRGKRDLNERI